MPGGLALRRDREKRRDLYRRNVCRRRPDTQKSKGSSKPSLKSCTHVSRTGAGEQRGVSGSAALSRRKRGRVGKNPIVGHNS